MIGFPGVGRVVVAGRERVLTMPTARRLVSTVVVAALAGAGLVACDRAPDVAVYFGSAKGVTEAEVQRVWDDTWSKTKADDTGKKPTMPTRQDIVNFEVYVAALKELGRSQGWAPTTQVSSADVATQIQTTPDAAFVQLVGEARTWLNAASERQPETADISPADLQKIYDTIKAAGYQGTFQQFSTQDAEALRQTGTGRILPVRNDLQQVVDNWHLKFNPRYAPPKLVLQNFPQTSVPVVEVTFGTAEQGPVTDLSAAAAAAQAQGQAQGQAQSGQ
jgi:hypothetical protein